MNLRTNALLLAAALMMAGCGFDRDTDVNVRLTVYNAGSLARPMRDALDSFSTRTGIVVDQETSGSLEAARKLTDLGKIPDLVALADQEVFPQLLMPVHVAWYVQFARNRMVLAFTEQSSHARDIDAANWWQVLQRPGVQVGRADPNLDPNGYRTLLVLQLAERHYDQPGLAQALLRAAPDRNVRPKESDLVALLQAGELDYIWSYESIALGAKLRYVQLPAEIDLSDPTRVADYATASVTVRGSARTDSLTVHGGPIVYGFSIPRRAPHPLEAERLAEFLISSDGMRILRAQSLDVLPRPIVIGDSAPASIAERARPASG